jgi:hypothetical protein
VPETEAPSARGFVRAFDQRAAAAFLAFAERALRFAQPFFAAARRLALSAFARRVAQPRLAADDRRLSPRVFAEVFGRFVGSFFGADFLRFATTTSVAEFGQQNGLDYLAQRLRGRVVPREVPFVDGRQIGE